MAKSTSSAHKTIFNTTEKSNFILNMTNDQFNKFASISTSIGLIIIFVMSCISELMSHSANSMANDWRIYPSFGLAVAGLLGISIFIIALIKQTLSKKQIIMSVAALIMLIFMYISYINAFNDIEDYSGFLGYRFGRYEGMMTYLSYLFVFSGAMSVNKKESVKVIFDTAVIIIFLQCIWSGLQMIPSFPSYYHKLPYIMDNVSLPSGATGSPIFLAALLGTGLSISVAGAVFDSSKKRKTLYCITSFLSSFFIIWTHSLIGMISSAVILIVFSAFSVICRKKKTDTKPSFLPIILMIAGAAAGFAVMLITTGIHILDGCILWHDGCQRLNSFGQHSSSGGGADLNDITSVYPFLWDKAAGIASKYPLSGTGPDGFILPDVIADDMFSVIKSNCFDRPYNEYLFYAATLGIPFAVSFALSLILCLVFSAGSALKFIKGKGNWIQAAAFAGTLSYIFITFINTSTATVTPYAWLLLGIGCCSFSSEKK